MFQMLTLRYCSSPTHPQSSPAQVPGVPHSSSWDISTTQDVKPHLSGELAIMAHHVYHMYNIQNFHKFRGFVAIPKSFLRKIHFFINSRKFSPTSIPLYPTNVSVWMQRTGYLILHLNNLHSFSVQVHHYHSACITLLSFPSSSSFAPSSLSIFRPNYCSPSLFFTSLSFSLELPPSFPPFTVPPSFTPFTIPPSLFLSSFYHPSPSPSIYSLSLPPPFFLLPSLPYNIV